MDLDITDLSLAVLKRNIICSALRDICLLYNYNRNALSAEIVLPETEFYIWAQFPSSFVTLHPAKETTIGGWGCCSSQRAAGTARSSQWLHVDRVGHVLSGCPSKRGVGLILCDQSHMWPPRRLFALRRRPAGCERGI